MKVSNISFKSGYFESANYIGTADSKVLKALNEARPFLRHIGYSMPDPKELIVTVGKDNNGDTFIKAYNHNAHNSKKTLIANDNNKTIDDGISFVAKIFKVLEKNNKREFNRIAGTFVKNIDAIDGL